MKCIIPARKGSKRVAKKNFRDFHGKPVLWYSIHAAREARLFTDIVLATDMDYVGDVSVYKRDRVDDEQTLSEFLLEYLLATKYEDKYICMLYACSPFVRPEYLREGFSTISTEDLDSVYAVAEGKGKVEIPVMPDRDFHVAGMFWFVNVDRFLESGKFFTNNDGYVIVPEYKGMDIDTPEEFAEAERIYGLLK